MPRYIKLKKKRSSKPLFGAKDQRKIEAETVQLYNKYTVFEERLGGATESSLQFRVFFLFCIVLLCRFFLRGFVNHFSTTAQAER